MANASPNDSPDIIAAAPVRNSIWGYHTVGCIILSIAYVLVGNWTLQGGDPAVFGQDGLRVMPPDGSIVYVDGWTILIWMALFWACTVVYFAMAERGFRELPKHWKHIVQTALATHFALLLVDLKREIIARKVLPGYLVTDDGVISWSWSHKLFIEGFTFVFFLLMGLFLLREILRPGELDAPRKEKFRHAHRFFTYRLPLVWLLLYVWALDFRAGQWVFPLAQISIGVLFVLLWRFRVMGDGSKIPARYLAPLWRNEKVFLIAYIVILSLLDLAFFSRYTVDWKLQTETILGNQWYVDWAAQFLRGEKIPSGESLGYWLFLSLSQCHS